MERTIQVSRHWRRRLLGAVLAFCLAIGLFTALPQAAEAADVPGFAVHRMGRVTLYTAGMVIGSDGFRVFASLDGYMPKTVSLTMTGDFTAAEQQAELEKGNLGTHTIPMLPLDIHDAAATDLSSMLNTVASYSRSPYRSSGTYSEAVYSIIPSGDQPVKGLSFKGYCGGFRPLEEERSRKTTRTISLDGQLILEWTVVNGYIASYKVHDVDFQTPPQDASEVSVTPTTSKVYLDGEPVELGAYNIGGNNYIKLRDIASLMNGTATQFDVAWHQEGGQIELLPGQSYTPTGVELGQLSPATALRSRSILTRMYEPLFSNGPYTTAEFLPMAYNIGGNNFYKLRDIAHIAQFTVLWDAATNSVHITSEKPGYRSIG